MKFGPVLSSVYDLIKGNGSKAGIWDDFIHTEGYAVELVADPGRGELSRAIVKKLTEVTERYRNLDEFELSDPGSCSQVFDVGAGLPSGGLSGASTG